MLYPYLSTLNGLITDRFFSSEEFKSGSLQTSYRLLYSKITQNDSKKKDQKELLFSPLFQSSKNFKKEGTLGNIENPYST